MSEVTAQARGRTLVAHGVIGAAAAILYVFLWATAFVPSRVLAREPLTARKLVGLLLGFSGVVLAMHTRAGSQEARVQDVLLAAAGVLAFVFSNILYKRMAERPHPLMLNGAQLLSAGVALLPAATVLEGSPRLVWTGPVV